MAEIRVPTLGESVTEATIGKWFKKAGDAVAVDEPLVELETDKVTIEVPAPAAGVLTDVAVKDGDTVAVGALLGAIKEGAGAAPAKPAAKAAAEAAPPPKPAAAPKAPAADVPLAPSVRKIAAETGMDTSTVPGTGKDGRVTKGDMLAAIERAAAQPTPVATPAAAVQVRAPSPADDAAREERVRMTRLRQTIARRLKDAQNTAAMLTTFNEVDMTHVMALRSQYRDLFEKKHGVKLGFMGFFVRPACRRSRKSPPSTPRSTALISFIRTTITSASRSALSADWSCRRTPGHETDLASGFLLTEGLIRSPRQIAAISYCPDGSLGAAGLVRVLLTEELSEHLKRRHRNIFSSCSLCGTDVIEAFAQGLPTCRKSPGRLDRRNIFQLRDAMERPKSRFADRRCARRRLG